MDQLEYYSFMGYPAEMLRERYVPYAALFAPASRVADVGCGRGEFLELLEGRGAQGIGIDADASMVELVRSKGLEAVHAEGLGYLRQHVSEFEGVFAAHLIEHLAPDPLLELLKAAAAALRQGGRLIVVSPNPSNLLMQQHDFWIDLQHVRFYSPHIIRWLFHLAGLRDVEIGYNDLYRLGPEWAVGGQPALPVAGRRRRARVRERVAKLALPPSVVERITELEQRVNLLSEWVTSLYPPGEYYVTGTR